MHFILTLPVAGTVVWAAIERKANYIYNDFGMITRHVWSDLMCVQHLYEVHVTSWHIVNLALYS